MTFKQVLSYFIVAVAAIAATAFITLHFANSPAEASEVIPAAQDGAKQMPSANPVAMIEPVTDQEHTAAATHVQKISEGKASVAEVFRGPSGYLGVVVNVGDSKFIGWMTPQLDAFFVGAMFDRTGKNVTQVEMLARGYAKPEPDKDQFLPPQAAIRKAVESTSSFIEGRSGPIVTAFIDFNCGYCRTFYQRSRPFVDRGAMRIKWVPVAILAEDSIGKAAAVMASHDPVGAVALTEENRLAPMKRVGQALQEKIGANTAVLNLLSGGKSGTPTLLLQKKDGTYSISPGMPMDLGAFLSSAGS